MAELTPYLIKILFSKENPEAKGIDFFVTSDGYILTCYHVIEALEEVWLTWKLDVEVDPKTGKWVKTDEILDHYIDRWLSEDAPYHISILGDLGTGKTSFCRQYTYKLIERYLNSATGSKTQIPLYLPLKHYAELGKEGGVSALITHLLVNQYKVQTNYEALKRFMSSGKLLLVGS